MSRETVQPIGKARITVGSKWGYTYTGAWRLDAPAHEVKDLSVENLRRQLGESRALLGDRLNLYQIHSATRESGVLENQEVLRELTRLRQGGLRIGLTVSGRDQAEVLHRALDVRVAGVPLALASGAPSTAELPAHRPPGSPVTSRAGSQPTERV